MSEATDFLERAAVKAADKEHALTLARACATHDVAVNAMQAEQYHDWQQARDQGARLKRDVLDRLPDLLETFEAKIAARGAKVLWAEDAGQARDYILEVVQRRGAKKVVKSKSMTTEEIGLNECLEDRGVEVWESDLGELIVQLAGEKPYHIVTPAMHKRKGEIAKLFQEKLNAPPTDSAEELTMVARGHLRQAYVTADIGVTGANFIIAEEGAILMTENEGNGRLSMSCPPVHIVIAGIEKVIPRLADTAFFLPLLTTSGTGQHLTCYSSIVRGPRQPDEVDGPEEMIVILLDNGRAKLSGLPRFRSSLCCIRCGACLNACPVFRTIGGHAYNTTYQGPIGSVLTPHFRGFERWQHLPACSSLCGACGDACPVEVPLPELLLENRREADRQKVNGLWWRTLMKVWAHIVGERGRLRRYRGVIARLLRLLPAGQRQGVPPLAAKSFARLWRERRED